VLVEEYLGENYSDGEPSVQSSGNPTQLAYLHPDKMTDFSRISRFGMTFKPLTESRGEELLTLYLADFPAKTLAPQEKAQESLESEVECGATWQGLLAKYDQNTSLWKTPQCSLLEESTEFLGIWPKWGLMQDGELYPQQTLVPRILEKESGLWPTPNQRDWKDSGPSQGKRKSPNLGTMVHWPTPTTKGMCGGSGAWDQLNQITTTEEAKMMGAGNGGTLNPTWVEWLMGWPLGWTDLKPLEMDKFQAWQQQHGVS